MLLFLNGMLIQRRLPPLVVVVVFVVIVVVVVVIVVVQIALIIFSYVNQRENVRMKYRNIPIIIPGVIFVQKACQ